MGYLIAPKIYFIIFIIFIALSYYLSQKQQYKLSLSIIIGHSVLVQKFTKVSL